MQLECMGGPLDGDVLPIPDDQTGFIADPVTAGAPRARYIVTYRWYALASGTLAQTVLVFDDWVSD